MIYEVNGQRVDSLTIDFSIDENWWGGLVAHGPEMPYGSAHFKFNQLDNALLNQAQPLLISSKGRYIWCEQPISYQFDKNSLIVDSDHGKIITGRSGKTLKSAYLEASERFFAPSGKMPDSLLFAKPQYNTWIELIYDQNEKDILDYAQAIIDNGLPPGVLMIDDNWQKDYGVWEFASDKFSSPKAMVEKLHGQGFKVMLWICPFISADSEIFRELLAEGVLLMDGESPNRPALIRWWNGYSALLDFTNPKAKEWFKSRLDHLQHTYDIDGFKFDAGDLHFYNQGPIIGKRADALPNDHMQLYAEIGLDYPLNEYRACWKLGGQPLAQRLKDKAFNWEDLRTLIPGILAQGMMGYYFACPDMIGGGQYNSFLKLDSIDQEMIVRSAQTHALMPMMQFSVAPWRILDAEHMEACKKAALLHEEFGDTLLSLANHAATTGEPIVRPMEYVFPNQGYAQVIDQFMLGNDILVAPALYKGMRKRKVFLPKGRWIDELGKKYRGGKSVEIEVPLERLPYFKKI
ncbi:MAG: glycoside hydrolase family 31 protein [Bacteroidota bacterium]